MQNLITAQEAFNAMVAGKNILCRAVGELTDFNDLDQFPATIFAKTGYEFCIKLDRIEVAGIAFTKPLTLEEIQDGQDVYVIQPHDSIYHYKYRRTAALDTAIERGFAQRDVENAKLQFKALCIALGRNAGTESLVVPVGTNHEKPKATRKTKAPVVANKNVQIAASNDVIEKTSQSSIQITAVDKTVIQEDNLVTFDDAKNQLSHEKSLRDRITAAESISDLEALLPELQQLHGESGHMIMSQYEQRKKEVKRLEILADLLEIIANAQTPAVANAQIRYARDWTVEQQVPLQKAISKRLCELAPVEHEMPPTLMDRIQKAPDLTTLDILEVDVGARSPDMQPKFMAEIVKRRRVFEGEVA